MMIFIIFTADGLSQAQSEISAASAEVWINPSLQGEPAVIALQQADLAIHLLPEEVDGSKEKPVVSALAHVEKHSPKGAEIYVEYV